MHFESLHFLQFEMARSAQRLTMHFRPKSQIRKCSRTFFIAWQWEVSWLWFRLAWEPWAKITSWQFLFVIEDLLSGDCFWRVRRLPIFACFLTDQIKMHRYMGSGLTQLRQLWLSMWYKGHSCKFLKSSLTRFTGFWKKSLKDSTPKRQSRHIWSNNRWRSKFDPTLEVTSIND